MAKNVAKRLFSQSPDKAMRSVCKERLATYLPNEAVDDIYRAYQYSEKAHRGQIRRTGEHYIFHPIAVADTLAELQMDTCSIMAALLHDVIEDTPTSKKDIKENFGDDVAMLVDGVSKICLLYTSPSPRDS